jgi:hypothetical protein
MDLEHLPSLYLGTQVVIVPRWDVRLILETVIDQILELYGEKDPDEKKSRCLMRIEPNLVQ